jgi:tetratricopeptide (TPR) repeat protein
MTLDQYSEAMTHISFCVDNLEKEEINKKDPIYRNHCKRLSKSYMIRAMCNIYTIYSETLSNKEELIQKVINDFSKSVDYGRREIEPWINRALIYMFYEKNYEKAVFNFSVALSRFGNSLTGNHERLSAFNDLPFDDKDILFLRAQCYERLNDLTSSISDYFQITERLNKKDTKQNPIFRSNTYTYKLLQLLLQNQAENEDLITLPSSDKTREQWLAILRTKIAVLILEQGKQAMEKKQEYDFSKFINKAMQNLWVALQHDPNYIDALYHRSKLYIQLFMKKEELNLELQDRTEFKEFYEKAIQDLSNLIKVDVDGFYTSYALYNRAILNFKSRQYQSVLDDATTCLKEENISPDMKQQLLKMRSQALLRLHRYVDYLKDRFY